MCKQGADVQSQNSGKGGGGGSQGSDLPQSRPTSPSPAGPPGSPGEVLGTLSLQCTPPAFEGKVYETIHSFNPVMMAASVHHLHVDEVHKTIHPFFHMMMAFSVHRGSQGQ